MATLVTAVGTVSASTSAGAPYYGALDMPVDASPRPKSPAASVSEDGIEAAVRQHQARMSYYRHLSGQDAPPEDQASQQSEVEQPRPSLWQSIWACLRCRD